MLADPVTSEVQTARKVNYQIAALLLERWSPRSMTGEPLTDEEFFPLFEAARWAPSSYNSQLWRFIVARRQNREEFDKFFGLLTPGNQIWAKNAAALVVLASRTRFEYDDKPERLESIWRSKRLVESWLLMQCKDSITRGQRPNC